MVNKSYYFEKYNLNTNRPRTRRVYFNKDVSFKEYKDVYQNSKLTQDRPNFQVFKVHLNQIKFTLRFYLCDILTTAPLQGQTYINKQGLFNYCIVKRKEFASVLNEMCICSTNLLEIYCDFRFFYPKKAVMAEKRRRILIHTVLLTLT